MVYINRYCCFLFPFLAPTFRFTIASSNNLQKQVDKFCGRFATPKKGDCDVGKPKKVVSFLTWYSKNNTQLGDHEAVKFDKVIENIRGGYNPATGKFTAPVSGIYTISVSVMCKFTSYMHLGIMKNTQLLTVLFSNEKTQASNTLNLFLKRNDTVWVQRRSGRVLHAHSAGPYNVFSGVLVTRM